MQIAKSSKQKDVREQLLDELVDELVSEGKSADELLGEDGIMKQLRVPSSG